jgi:hypothetical protein
MPPRYGVQNTVVPNWCYNNKVYQALSRRSAKFSNLGLKTVNATPSPERNNLVGGGDTSVIIS